jgi:hypothetical protein
MADQKYNILLTATDETRAAFESVKNGFDEVNQKFVSMQTLAVSAGIASMVAFAKSAIDSGDELFLLSQKTGIAVENLAGLEHAAKLNGSSLEGVATGVKKLSTYLFDAAAGGKEQANMLHILGVTAKEPLPALEQIADKFAQMPDGAEKSALAVKLFGKAGLDMIPMLDGGGKALKDMIEEGQRLNPVTAEFTAAANAFNDNLDRMHEKAKGNAFVFANELLPTLNGISEAILHASSNADAFSLAGQGVGEVLKTLVVLGANTAYIFKEIGNDIGGMGAQLNALAHADFEGFGKLHDMMIADGEAARIEIDKFSESVINGSKKIADAAADAPKKDDTAAQKLKALAAAEAAVKANQAIIDAAKKADEATLMSHEDAFTKWKKSWQDTEDKLTALGAAGTEARKKHEAAYTVYVDAENAKRNTDAANKLNAELNKENEYFAKIHAMAEDAATTARGREKLRYDREVLDLQNRRNAAAKSHVLSLAELAAFHQAELELESNHNAILRTLKDDSDRETVGNEIRWKQVSLDSSTEFFGMAKGLMNSHSHAMFAIGKASAMTEAIIHTYSAATKAYSAMAGIPIIGPGLGAVAAAAAIASGMAQVSAIQSQSFGGSAGGGSYGGASSSLNGGQATPNYPSSPASNSSSPQAQNQQAQQAPPQTTINIYNSGNVLSTDFVMNSIIPQIKNAVNNSDVLIIDPRSRQAQVLGVA